MIGAIVAGVTGVDLRNVTVDYLVVAAGGGSSELGGGGGGMGSVSGSGGW